MSTNYHGYGYYTTDNFYKKDLFRCKHECKIATIKHVCQWRMLAFKHHKPLACYRRRNEEVRRQFKIFCGHLIYAPHPHCPTNGEWPCVMVTAHSLSGHTDRCPATGLDRVRHGEGEATDEQSLHEGGLLRRQQIWKFVISLIVSACFMLCLRNVFPSHFNYCCFWHNMHAGLRRVYTQITTILLWELLSLYNFATIWRHFLLTLFTLLKLRNVSICWQL